MQENYCMCDKVGLYCDWCLNLTSIENKLINNQGGKNNG